MSEMSNEAIQATINQRTLRVGNTIHAADVGLNAAASASAPIYSDSSSTLAVGNIPFAFPLFAGATDTSFSVASFSGSTTGAADVSMTQTFVQGAAASLTTTGFLRITITDNAGNLTNGAYYIPFGTLA